MITDTDFKGICPTRKILGNIPNERPSVLALIDQNDILAIMYKHERNSRFRSIDLPGDTKHKDNFGIGATWLLLHLLG